jgi:hypothetical protein
MTDPKPFVIDEHTTPTGVHWDLMLQMGDALWTWRLAVHPEKIGSNSVAAERIADHPLRFLSYQGPVQNHTGSVRIAECGECTLENQTQHELTLHFKGKSLTGRYMLTQQNENCWLLRLAL